MVQAVKVVTGDLSATLNGTTDFTFSGFGTPSAAIIIWTKANTVNNPSADAEIGFGFWDGTNQRCGVAVALDNSATSGTSRASNDSFGVITGSTESDYTVTSITDGIRLTLTVDGTTLLRKCTVLLLSGISASAMTITMNPTQNSATTISGLSFAPKLVLFGSICGGTADVAPAAQAIVSLGVADITGVHRSAAWGSQSAQADEISNIQYTETRCVTRILANALVWSGEVTSWTSDGFVITTRDGGSSSQIVFALALGGADLSYDLGTLTTQTGTGAVTEPTDVTPEALLMGLTTASDTALKSATTEADGITFAMARPPVVATANNFAHGISVLDGAATTNTDSFAHTAATVAIRSNGTYLVEGDITAFNPKNFEITYNTVSATARKGWWLAFGPVSGAYPPWWLQHTNEFLGVGAQ